MNLTLHLTENCNLNCTYCVRNHVCKDMSKEVLDAACELIFSDGKAAGFSFFGGEPMLKKDMIVSAMEKCQKKSKELGVKFSSKMTTNGTLLDESFLEWAKENNLVIGLSFDGVGQDICRKYVNGEGTFSVVSKKAQLLLKYMPKSYGMLTIAPEAAGTFADGVKYMYELGFRRMTATIALGKYVTWDEESLSVIEKEMEKIGDFYIEKMKEGDPFFFSSIDGKIRDAIEGSNPKERCHLGKKQMQVAVDGKMYACTQFVGDEDYCLGDVFHGIDYDQWSKVLLRSANTPENEDCLSCVLRKRCTHTCGCVNRMETGNEYEVSPTQCLYEQIIIREADRVADILCAYDEKAFAERYARAMGTFLLD